MWDKYSGEFIGFVDLGDTHTNFPTLDDAKELATHILDFLVKSIIFATIMPILWEAVLYLDKCGFKVVYCTEVGASPNRNVFRSIKHWNLMRGKMLFIKLKPFTLKKIALLISFVTFHI